LSRALKLSEDLRPVSELKTQSSDVLRHAERTGRPVVLTRHGKGVAVLMSLEAFEELEASARRADLLLAVQEAERALAGGSVVDHREVEQQLEAWERGD
jgi:antitoxin YefM